MKPHKHAELIKAWADGAEIQISVSRGELWEDAQPSFLVWNDEYQYRIKPEPKPDRIIYTNVKLDKDLTFGSTRDDNLKLTFDGETGELKLAEVLK